MATKSTLITIREAARRLGVHENTVRRYADSGLIRAERLPSGVRRLRRADVEALGARAAGTDDGDATGERPSVSADELVAATGAKPIRSVEDLAHPDLWDSDDEVERFIEMTLAERRADR